MSVAKINTTLKEKGKIESKVEGSLFHQKIMMYAIARESEVTEEAMIYAVSAIMNERGNRGLSEELQRQAKR